MPWSATISSAQVPSTRTRTCTLAPGSLYFTAFSTMLPSAETSWRRSPLTRTPVGSSSTVISICRFSASARARATASSTMSTMSMRSRNGSSPSSIRESSSRSSMVRDTRSASSTMRSATRWTTSRSSSSASASARTASAPTGVFSSWLMLATKSVRTASTRRRSLTSSIVATAPPPSSGDEVTTTAKRGGPYSSRSCREGSPSNALASSRSTVSSTSRPMCVPASPPAARLR